MATIKDIKTVMDLKDAVDTINDIANRGENGDSLARVGRTRLRYAV